MKNAVKTVKNHPSSPQKLELMVRMDALFPDHYNSLFIENGSGRLFMTDSETDTTILRPDGVEVPSKESIPEDFEEVSVKEALVWYAVCEPCSRGGTGDVSLLCEMAAKRL